MRIFSRFFITFAMGLDPSPSPYQQTNHFTYLFNVMRLFPILLFSTCIFSAAAQTVIELPADSVLTSIGSKYCYVTDNATGKEIPSQITHDNLLLFAPMGGYTIHPSDTLHKYAPVCVGRVHPERADDLGWENDLVGFRAYGPATRRKGERAYGYDLFFIYSGNEPVVDRLYANSTNPRKKELIDSVRVNHPEQLAAFSKSFNLHADHGIGYDCYAVGPTLGDGASAIVRGDSLDFSWCYDKVEILDQGPLRFTAHLTYYPTDKYTEHRVITLDKGQRLNRTSVWFEPKGDAVEPLQIAVGFPLRDDSDVYSNGQVLAYADPTQGPGNGKALVGLVLDGQDANLRKIQDHAVYTVDLQDPSKPFTYRWGYAWSRVGFPDLPAWASFLNSVAKK